MRVTTISRIEISINFVGSYAISHDTPSGKFLDSLSSSFLTAFTVLSALASVVLNTPRPTELFPLKLQLVPYESAPSSIRAISFRRTIFPSSSF